MNNAPKRSLGRTELVDLPQLQWLGANAVIDSGAYHCAIHCINFHLDGDALLVTWQGGTVTRHEQFRKVTVKSSFGDRQERYLIYLQLRVYGEDFNQEFSLSDRSRMRNPLTRCAQLTHLGVRAASDRIGPNSCAVLACGFLWCIHVRACVRASICE